MDFSACHWPLLLQLIGAHIVGIWRARGGLFPDVGLTLGSATPIFCVFGWGPTAQEAHRTGLALVAPLGCAKSFCPPQIFDCIVNFRRGMT